MTEEDKARYRKAQHAMQTGVATMMSYDISDIHHKSLRTGINSSMVDNTALAKLLTEKGIITRDEYEKALADEMEAEVERYKQMIKDAIGKDVELV